MNENIAKNFYDLFKKDHATLKVRFDVNSVDSEVEVNILNKLVKQNNSDSLNIFGEFLSEQTLNDFAEFYQQYDGFCFETFSSSINVVKKTLLRQLSISDINAFTNQYLSGGKLAWTIDLNKTKLLFRSNQKWVAFADVNEGPSCLAIFLTGENKGNIFLISAQPHFNNLKPIAKSYNDFQKRISKDPAAFFKLLKAYVVIKQKDNQNYGYVPIEYMTN